MYLWPDDDNIIRRLFLAVDNSQCVKVANV